MEDIYVWLSGYVHSHELTRGKVQAAYVFSEGQDDYIEGQIRSKSLAAVLNYIQIHSAPNGNKRLSVNSKSLNEFLSNKVNYSIEHFIIGESGSLKIKTEKYDFEYEYPSSIKKYRNSLFNYIFIPENINTELGNGSIYEKQRVLQKKMEQITCDYSKNYINTIFGGGLFTEYPTNKMIDGYNSKEEVLNFLDRYFSNQFPSDLLSFASALTKTISFA